MFGLFNPYTNRNVKTTSCGFMQGHALEQFLGEQQPSTVTSWSLVIKVSLKANKNFFSYSIYSVSQYSIPLMHCEVHFHVYRFLQSVEMSLQHTTCSANLVNTHTHSNISGVNDSYSCAPVTQQNVLHSEVEITNQFAELIILLSSKSVSLCMFSAFFLIR